MPTIVFTETKCQGCGKVQRREGTPDGPPPAWMQGRLTIYGEGNAIRQDVWVGELCVSCGDKVLAALGVKRKRERRATAPEQPLVPDTHEQDETGVAPPGAVTFHQPAYRYVPGHHEQPQVEYVERPAIIMPKPAFMPSTTTVAIGDDPQAPQTTDIAHTEPYVTTTVELPDAGLIAKAVEQASGTPGASKAGWPKGLGRKLTPCPHSAIPHRHRVEDPSKPTELTCVGITYPEKEVGP